MPVIKSIGRKDTKFGQLISYLHKEDGGAALTWTYLHNMNGVEPDDLKGMENAFTANDTFRKKRKNGVGQYHEIISFHGKDAEAIRQNPEILWDFTRIYMELRAEEFCIPMPPSEFYPYLHGTQSPRQSRSCQSPY